MSQNQDLHYITEGPFDGEFVKGNNGKFYPVNGNYISKSRLLEGDILKVNLSDEGKLMFKQIQSVPRKTAIGTVAVTKDFYLVMIGGKAYKINESSFTYYHLQTGDLVSVVIPEKNPYAEYAAVEAKL